MLPASKAAESLNSLIDVLKDFQEKRAYLSPIHERRMQGLVDKVPAESKLIAECMRDCFLRDYKSADRKLDAAAAETWPEGSYELNIATGMLESLRFDDSLAYLKSRLDHHCDDPEFLYDASGLLVSVGMHKTAKKVCDRLDKLNVESAPVSDAAEFYSAKYDEFGVTDEMVADFATKAAAPLKEYLLHKQKIVYDITCEFLPETYPQTIAYVFHVDAGVEEIVNLSDLIADFMAEFEFDEAIDRHFAYSVWAHSEERMKYAS